MEKIYSYLIVVKVSDGIVFMFVGFCINLHTVNIPRENVI